MPRVLCLAPCEKAILEKDTGSLTLASVFYGLTFTLEKKGALSKDARLPKDWYVGVTWRAEKGDQGKEFEQRFELLSPSHRVLATGLLQLDLAGKTNNSAMHFQGFPIGRAGDYTLRLSYREVPDGKWHVVARAPIELTIEWPESQEEGQE